MNNKHIRALRAAFPHTIPILTGFMFLGLTYGIYMNVSGFSFWYPCLISLFVFAGSAQFVTVNLLLGAFSPLQAFAMILMINARHIFYGLSMLEKYKGLGLKKLYLIFGLCDETFSINCSADIPDDVDKGLFMFYITLLNQTYWVIASTLGGIFGSLLTISTKGLDFVMTAMFVVIFIEQWTKEKDHTNSLLGLFLPLVCLLIFGADSFIIPSMAAILAALLIVRTLKQKGGAQE